MSVSIPDPARAVMTGGPHCGHDGCCMHVCDESGYAEHPCLVEGCAVCGAPSPGTPEHWAGDPVWFIRLTGVEQARVRAYWDAHPAMRRADDAEQAIPPARHTAAFSRPA